MKKLLVLLTIATMALVSGCAGQADIPTVISPSATVLPPTATATLTLSPAPEPTQTLIPTLTSTPTPSPTLTPVPNPMEIETMRQGSYPGSDIVVVKELDKGINYRRYYAWYRSDGLKIYGLLTVPDSPMPAGGYPALVFLHGYIPPASYSTTEYYYVAHVDFLARSGYVVFKIDLRGHDRSEGVADGGYATPGYTDDVLNAVASLQRNPLVNPNKIGMWGHSMGGFLTLRAMVISKQIKVGVVWGGLVCSYPDIFYRWRQVDDTPASTRIFHGWQAEWIARYGTPEQNPDFWNSISATSFLADLSGPLELHHGEADTTVPPAFSRELAAAVTRAGGTAELFTYEGDNHNISNSFTLAMARSVQFFDKYLK